MSLKATDIERRLRANRDAFVLKEHVSGRPTGGNNNNYSNNNKAFLSVGSGHDFRGSGQVLKFGPACNSELNTCYTISNIQVLNCIFIDVR